MTNQTKNSSSSGSFQSLRLSPSVYQGIQSLGYRMPTPVQRKSLPTSLSGSDVVVMARTGSGKTVAFLIPVLERLLASRRSGDGTEDSRNDYNGYNGSGGFNGYNGSGSFNGYNGSGGGFNGNGAGNQSAGAVILSPTRELSVQTLKVLRTLSKHTTLTSAGINGGESMEKQFALLSSRPDILVATPGRLAHHLSEIPDLHLNSCEMVVFDEADRLFEMGFATQIRSIVAKMPECRQTLLFSATMPRALVEFTKTIQLDPVVIRLDSEVSVSEELRMGFVLCRGEEKDAVLLHLLRDVLPEAIGAEGVAEDTSNNNSKDVSKNSSKDTSKDTFKNKPKVKKGSKGRRGLTLIFAATRHHAEYLTLLLQSSNIPATQIYGSMDQTARNQNLASFASGQTPTLVVTDVAARGIDVPLIDHVVHYAFPHCPKLFVHRSGRAARAGRVGYCWGLVDSEELPYLVDLHLFLGKDMLTGYESVNQESDPKDPTQHDKHNHGDDNHANEQHDKEQPASHDEETCLYSIQDMTTNMVHYGKVPESVLVEEVENVRRIVDSELASSHDADMLKSLTKVCANAMKQYRRTRPEASREGVRRAKALLEGEKEVGTGRRIFHGTLPTHPLLRFIELQKLKQSLAHGTTNADKGVSENDKQLSQEAKCKINNLQKRQEFLRAMANFRPKETVFEAFSTTNPNTIYSSQVDKITGGNGAALAAMKSMRREMKIARDKGSALVIAGSTVAKEMNGELDMAEVNNNEEEEIDGIDNDGDEMQNDGADVKAPSHAMLETKRRLSKAQRKKMKKDPNYKPESSHNNAINMANKRKRGSDYQDTLHYIAADNTDTAEAARSRHIESSLQPSSAVNSKSTVSLAHTIEQTMLDIVGDDNADLVQRQRMTRWDKSKKRYVRTTVGEELRGDSKSKKMRLESGQLVKSEKLKLGELYEKWQKKTNRSIGRVGVFDDVTGGDETDVGTSGRGNTAGTQRDNGANGHVGKTDEIQSKSAIAIRKEREMKENLRMKNMKRGDRRILERKQREEKAAAESARKKGYQGKKGSSGRWKGSVKKKGKR